MVKPVTHLQTVAATNSRCTDALLTSALYKVFTYLLTYRDTVTIDKQETQRDDPLNSVISLDLQ